MFGRLLTPRGYCLANSYENCLMLFMVRFQVCSFGAQCLSLFLIDGGSTFACNPCLSTVVYKRNAGGTCLLHVCVCSCTRPHPWCAVVTWVQARYESSLFRGGSGAVDSAPFPQLPRWLYLLLFATRHPALSCTPCPVQPIAHPTDVRIRYSLFRTNEPFPRIFSSAVSQNMYVCMYVHSIRHLDVLCVLFVFKWWLHSHCTDPSNVKILRSKLHSHATPFVGKFVPAQAICHRCITVVGIM